MDNSLFNAPEPIFSSDQEPDRQLYLDGFAPDAFEDIGQSTTARWSNERWNGVAIVGSIFYDSRTVVADTGIDVLDSNGTVQSGWAICTNIIAPPRHSFGYSGTITATPPATPKVSGNFRLRYRGATSSAVYADTTAIWSNLYGGRTLRGRITFYDESVSGITESDFEIVTSAGESTTGWDILSVSSSAVSAGQYVDVVASPPTNTTGDFRLQLKVNSIRRAGGNYPAIAIFSRAIYIDDRTQAATMATASWSHVTGGQFLRGRVTFNGATVTNVSSSDFEIINSSGTVQSNWCIHVNNTFTTTSENYITVTANPPAGQNANFRIRLKANSVRSGGATENNAPTEAQSTPETAIDSRAPASPIIAGATWSNVSGGTRLSGDLTFTGAAVTHIDPEDFQVLNSSGASQSNWVITVSSSSVLAGGFITVHAVPPNNVDADFRLRLNMNSVRSGGSSTDNAPTSNEDTDLETVNNTIVVATLAFGNISRIPDRTFDLQIPITVTGANITSLDTIGDFGVNGPYNFLTQVPEGGNTYNAGNGYRNYIIDADSVYDSLTDTNLPGILEGNTKILQVRWEPIRRQPGIFIRNRTVHTGLDQYIRFTFRENTTRSGGSTIDNCPSDDVVSNSIYINTYNIWTITGGRILTGNISGLSITDQNTQVDILDAQNIIITGWRIVISNNNRTITAHPPPNTGGLFRLRYNARTGTTSRGESPFDNVISNAVVIDNISAIAVATWSNMHYCTTSGKLQGTLTFTGVNITNLEASDFEISGRTGLNSGWVFDAPPSSATVGSGILIAATPPPNTNDRYGFLIRAGRVRSAGASFNNSPVGDLYSERIIVDNRPATVSDGVWSNIDGGVVLNGRMTFTGAAVTGIEDDDFAVLDDSNMEQSGWMIDVSASFTTAGGFVDVSATPPVGTSGNFKLQLDATSVMSGGSNLNNAPAMNIISTEVAIDTTGLIVTWGTPIFCGTSNEDDSTIAFSHDVTKFTVGDIVVRNAGDTADVPGWTHTISGSGRTYTIESVPPAATNSIFRLRLLASSVSFRPSETGPTHNADSPQFNVDNRTSLNPPSAEFVIPNDVQTGATTDITVSFGERVWILSDFDFTITGHDPEPSKTVLARDHQIRIRAAQSNAPLFRLRNIPSAPSILSTIRSPLGPSSGPTDRWIIRLNRPFRDLTPNEVVYKTISTGPDVSLSRNPIFLDSNYILRITNPTNASGTLNAVLRKYAVNAADDNLRGPEVPQNSGSYAFDTIILPQFTIGDAYASGDASDTTSLDEPLDEPTVYIEIEIDQNVDGLTATDFIVSGACGGSPLSIITENRKWRLPVHIPDADKGSMTVAIPSNVVTQRNQPSSRTFEFDRTTEGQLEQPYLVISNLPTVEQTGTSFTFTVTAYVDGTMVNLENLEPSDFIVTSPEGNITPTSVA